MTLKEYNEKLDALYDKYQLESESESVDWCKLKAALTQLHQQDKEQACVETLEDLELWMQQYGYEMHVSHVCPMDSVSCARSHGRGQKAQQIHEEIRSRIATLKASQQGGDK